MRRIEILGRIASSFRYRSRRTFLKSGLAWVAALPFFPTIAESARSSPISQPKTPSHQAFMKQALEMRTQALSAGDQGYGAIVVKNEKIVGLGPSRVIVNSDPTAHAEMEAIRDAVLRKKWIPHEKNALAGSINRPAHSKLLIRHAHPNLHAGFGIARALREKEGLQTLSSWIWSDSRHDSSRTWILPLGCVVQTKEYRKSSDSTWAKRRVGSHENLPRMIAI